MNADIRPARVSDIDTLLSIENRVFETDRLSRRAFRRHLSSATASLLVAAREGLPVGYGLVLYRRGSRVARLYSIAVSPENGSAGLGRGLLRSAEEAARARGCLILRLEVREANARAIGLYQRAGYRPIGRKPYYYEDGAAALRFEKHLGERKD